MWMIIDEIRGKGAISGPNLVAAIAQRPYLRQVNPTISGGQ